VMLGWKLAPFDEVISDETGGNLKTLQSDFSSSGRYPIVDQGKGLIAGYTDGDNRLCSAPAPVIIFGDHTRAFKFVDFPFCLGAEVARFM
jgi:type I restriction enzyme S subunit